MGQGQHPARAAEARRTPCPARPPRRCGAGTSPGAASVTERLTVEAGACYVRPEPRERALRFTLECEREDDGRWIAEVMELAGVIVYGATRDEAIARAQMLALRVIADRLEHGEMKPLDISFQIPTAA